MMRFVLTIVFLLLSSTIAKSEDIVFFDTNVLGSSVRGKVELLESNESVNKNLIEPTIIQVDINNGIFTDSSIYYPADKITFSELVSQIEKKYQVPRYIDSETGDYYVWRVESKQFAISLCNEIEENMYRIIYLKFR